MTPTPPASPERIFRVRYDHLRTASDNPELKGAGELAVRADRGTFAFTGTNRTLFSRQRKTIFFTTDDIRNVVQTGERLSFVTNIGKCGRLNRRFEFLAENAAEAAELRALLPTRTDDDFVAEQDFAARLNLLPGASSWFTSVTGLIVLTNVAAFVVLAVFFNAGWFEVESMDAYIGFGANNGAATTDGQWWRLLTSAFLHYGLIHLALNMWALASVGNLLERLLGRPLYLLLYFGSALGGSLLSIGWHGDKIWSAGASGAVFGIYGGLLAYALRQKQALPRSVWKPLQNSALTFAGYNLLYGLVHPGIDNAAHIGGLLAGLLLGWLIAVPVDLSLRPALIRRNLLLGFSVTAIVVSLGIATIPRFDYRISEEVAWEKAIKGCTEKESELLKQDNESRKLIGSDEAARLKYGQWLGAELVPFYDSWSQQLAALRFTPKLATERRRLVLLEYFRLRADSYRHLRSGLDQNDRDEVNAYRTLADRAQQKLREFNP